MICCFKIRQSLCFTEIDLHLEKIGEYVNVWKLPYNLEQIFEKILEGIYPK